MPVAGGTVPVAYLLRGALREECPQHGRQRGGDGGGGARRGGAGPTRVAVPPACRLAEDGTHVQLDGQLERVDGGAGRREELQGAARHRLRLHERSRHARAEQVPGGQRHQLARHVAAPAQLQHARPRRVHRHRHVAEHQVDVAADVLLDPTPARPRPVARHGRRLAREALRQPVRRVLARRRHVEPRSQAEQDVGDVVVERRARVVPVGAAGPVLRREDADLGTGVDGDEAVVRLHAAAVAQTFVACDRRHTAVHEAATVTGGTITRGNLDSNW